LSSSASSQVDPLEGTCFIFTCGINLAIVDYSFDKLMHKILSFWKVYYSLLTVTCFSQVETFTILYTKQEVTQS
jgi:hypothetical protein